MAQLISLDLIRLDGGTQPRQGIDWEVAYEYGDLMADGVKLPPVTVFYDGSDYWLADGFHRVHAASSQDIQEIAADVLQGTLEDAQWFSFGANKSHGLMRSNDDKQRAVQAALRHPKCAGLSNRQIAQHVGVSHQTVNAWREKLEATGKVSQSFTRKGADGRITNITNIGKKAEPVPPQAPAASAQPAPAPQREEPQAPPEQQHQPEPEPSDSHDLEVFRLHLLGIIETPLTARLLADEITDSPEADETRELIRRAHEFLTAVTAGTSARF